jgi:holin-like protein
MIGALLALLFCQLVGESLVRLLHVPVPGPVAGLVLMLGFLLLRRRVPKDLETTARGLLSHLSLLFVPAGVGIVVHLHRVANEWFALTAALILSTALSIGVTALVFKLVHRAPPEGASETSAEDAS